jgi:hypothetical protein
MALNTPKLNASKIFREAFNLNTEENEPVTRPTSAASSTGYANHSNKRRKRLLDDEEYEAFAIYYKTCYPEKFSSLNYESQDKNIIDKKINETDKQKFKHAYKSWKINNPTNNITEFAKELCAFPLSGGRARTTKRKAKKRHNKRKTRR